ncbi:hypothetical protein J3R30DRAFT_3282866 [Lentinula aciculospora]|uniref:F-box domain-containing protein n=1 Tax=Lentinula aciculospora TaxID=153920 RepID=A0A9W9DTJ5_9AGAR|nr:hypothetical protein J3R30DRAFT_3282866 [Lentinula aciculospora]
MRSPLILRDPDVTQKLLEAIIDTPGGKRTVSRLARTCRAISEPALNVLWRDLDSLIPIIGLFPSTMLKKVRKPGLGLSKEPTEEDWAKIMTYGERVRSVAYNETANNISPTVFPMLTQNRPREYMLPNLSYLAWKIETSGALDYCSMFLSPAIEGLHFELGPARFPNLNRILGDACSRLNLTSFSIISPASLPDTFTVILSSQKELQKVALVAPGALSSGVGRWVASLPELKSLQLDLSARTLTAVEGFFDELPSDSGVSTPNSVATTDSGVFSSEELDFSEKRKSLTGGSRSKGAFSTLRHVQLTGDVAKIAVFLKHFSTPLTQLDLVIEDPPGNAEWMELSDVISKRFGSYLQSLRISATATSKFNDLVRSTSRGEPTVSRLALEHLHPLPALRRLDIDLPESINFIGDDIEALARACPNLEELKLCPLARFPVQSGPPKLTLEQLAPLTEYCRRLHTLSVPVNARRAGPSVLISQSNSSSSLRRIHVGHSWVNDSLHVSILLSHLAPYLDNLKWFHDKNRPGFIETNARGWEKVADTLPHIQNIRLTERKTASAALPSFNVESKPSPTPHASIETAEKGIMAVVSLVHQGILAKPGTINYGVQWGPRMVNESVEVHPDLVSASIDAVPEFTEIAVEAVVVVADESVEAIPETVAASVDASPSSVSKSVEAMLSKPEGEKSIFHLSSHPVLFPVFGLISFAYRVLFAYPISIPLRMLHVIFDHMPTMIRRPGSSTNDDISMNALQVRGS